MEKMLKVCSGQLAEAILFIERHLDAGGISGKEKARAMLMAEESLVQLFVHSGEETRITIKVVKLLGDVTFYLYATGDAFDFFNKGLTEATLGIDVEGSEPDETVIRSYYLKAYEDHLRYQNKKGVNCVRIKAVRSRYKQLYLTIGGMVLGILLGFLVRLALPQDVGKAINTGLFGSIITVFMNLLQTVVGPVVFFSIASSIAGFGDLSVTGRIGGKVLALYIGVSVLAIGIGIGAWYIFRPGDPALMNAVNASYTVDISSAQNISLLDTLVGIAPSNILKPFLDASMLQIICLAVLVGVGAGMIGNYSEIVRTALEALNQLFLRITMIFVKAIPLVALCSMASMVVTTGGAAFVSILFICGVIIAGFAAMMVIYGIMLLCSGVNPFLFYRKYFGTMIQVFAISSSNAAIPINMEACDEKLGVSPKVYSLSIPLGATINMHGLCIYLSVMALSFAKVYGVSITGGKLAGMILSIVLIAMGCPGIPGAGLVILAVILSQFGIPIAAVSLVTGINPLIDMFITAVNCLGDVATTMVVAKSEKLVDMQRFRA